MNAISAEAMAVAVESDPQFSLPLRPKWADGLVTVPIEDGLLVEGGPDRQVLRGAAAVSLLPRLIERLDGSRELPDLAETLEISVVHAHQAVALLYSCGLLEDGADDDRAPSSSGSAEDGAGDHPAPPDLGAEVRTFLSRQVDSTRVNRSAAGALRRLAAASVCIAGGGHVGELIAADLEATGAGRVALAASPSPGDTLVVGLGAGEQGPDLKALDDRCAELGIPWLRIVLDGGGVEIGPRFDRTHTACLRCLEAARQAPADRRAEDQRAEDRHRQALIEDRRIPEGRADLAAGIAGVHIAHAIARVGGGVPPGSVARIELDGFVQRVIPVAPRPGCPYCSPRPQPEPAPVTLPYAYEQSVAFPPRELLDPKDHQHHYKPANLRLQRDGKRYPGARRIALEPVGFREPVGSLEPVEAGAPDAARPARPEASRLDHAALADLLGRAFGLRHPGTRPDAAKVERWAPTGGNLGSPQAYPLVAEVAGLDPGPYFYLAHEHELVRLPNGEGRAWSTAAAVAAPEDLEHAAAIIVLTGALDRVASKYGTFGYRIVNLDAGCAVAQLALAAAARGVEVRVAPRWDDGLLADALRIDLDGEPVTAVVGLGRIGAADGA